MNYKTRCTKVYLELQKILASTRLPMALIDWIIRFVLVEVGTRLFTKMRAVGILYDMAWDNNNNIEYHIAYVTCEWNKCIGECNWDEFVFIVKLFILEKPDELKKKFQKP